MGTQLAVAAVRDQRSRADDDYLTPAEVEAEYRIPRCKLRRWRGKGTGPQFRQVSQRQVIYRRDAIEEWLTQQTQERLSAATQPPLNAPPQEQLQAA